MVSKVKDGNLHRGAFFVVREGLLYQEDPGMARQAGPSQLLIAQQHRPLFCLAHDIHMAGHLVVKKTLERVLHFYWPGFHTQVRCNTIAKPALNAR